MTRLPAELCFERCAGGRTGLVCAVVALAAFPLFGAISEKDIASDLGKPFLDGEPANSSLTSVFEEVAVADRAADRRWRMIANESEYDTYRKDLKAKMISAIGGFPEKTPLNAKVVATLRRDGYTVDKVLFESMPGVYVTGHFFRPAGEGPFATVVVTCGHSDTGKNYPAYQRACVQLVGHGLASFIYDPYDQGDRLQQPSYGTMAGHNAIGVRAMLLGWSMAQLRLWDGIRAIDYVITRPDVKKDAIGYQGQSGGGTMTALMMAIDDRIRAAAPSCYITNMRELAWHCGPQDAEQNIFGQLAFGLNHAGYVLMQDIPVMVVCKKGDFFPYYGTCETFDLVTEVADRIGRRGQYMLFAEPGPHGWVEATREASAIWMENRLAGGTTLPDSAALQLLDQGFDLEKECDAGLSMSDAPVPPGGQVRDLPGFRSIYDVLRVRLKALEKDRRSLTAPDRAAFAIRHAKINLAVRRQVRTKLVSTSTGVGYVVARYAIALPNGLVLPAVMLMPEKETGDPVLLIREGGRAQSAVKAANLLNEGRHVMVLDYTAAGEVACIKNKFYDSDNVGEEVAQLLYWLGDSLVGRRATDILVAADLCARLNGRKPVLFATGDAVVPAAHAFAADAAAFSAVTIEEAPHTWSEIVRGEEPCDFANCVNGALIGYDWPDLLP